MSYIVDNKNVSIEGLEKASNLKTLAGLRANEARYFSTKYKMSFM